MEDYRLRNVRVDRKKENIMGKMNHSDTFRKLKSLFYRPYRYS